MWLPKAPDFWRTPSCSIRCWPLCAPTIQRARRSLDVLRKVKDIEQRPDFRAALSQLQKDSNPRLKLIAESVLEGKKLSEALKDVQPGSVLDFNYFVTKIEPILAKPGADGKACVFCHASHVIFKLQPPNERGRLLRPGQRR
jgi:hypothetical protein